MPARRRSRSRSPTRCTAKGGSSRSTPTTTPPAASPSSTTPRRSSQDWSSRSRTARSWCCGDRATCRLGADRLTPVRRQDLYAHTCVEPLAHAQRTVRARPAVVAVVERGPEEAVVPTEAQERRSAHRTDVHHVVAAGTPDVPRSAEGGQVAFLEPRRGHVLLALEVHHQGSAAHVPSGPARSRRGVQQVGEDRHLVASRTSGVDLRQVTADDLADHEVVPRLARENVRAVPRVVDDVVTEAPVDQVLTAEAAQLVVARPAPDPVVTAGSAAGVREHRVRARTRAYDVGTLRAVEKVGARAAVDHVAEARPHQPGRGADERVGPVTGGDACCRVNVDRARRGVPHDRVVVHVVHGPGVEPGHEPVRSWASAQGVPDARTALVVEGDAVRAAEDAVPPWTAPELVCAVTPADPVVSTPPVDAVAAGQPSDHVVAPRTDQHVVTPRPHQGRAVPVARHRCLRCGGYSEHRAENEKESGGAGEHGCLLAMALSRSVLPAWSPEKGLRWVVWPTGGGRPFQALT